MKHGQIAMITGGGSGLGRALGEEIGRRGGTVVVTDINLERAEAVAAQILQDGGQATALPMDVTRLEEVRQTIAQVLQQYGRIDYYYNNAGISFAGEARDMTYDHWKRIVNVNLWGVLYGAQEAYQAMIDQGSGHIINVASLAGIVANVHAPAYTMTKSAVVGLSNALRIEAEDLGVRVSLICPGAVKTGIRDTTSYLKTDKEAFLKGLEQMRKTKWYAKEWDAQTAARYIVGEVDRGTYLILLPPAARTAQLVARLFPGYVYRVQRKMLKRFRSYRIP